MNSNSFYTKVAAFLFGLSSVATVLCGTLLPTEVTVNLGDEESVIKLVTNHSYKKENMECLLQGLSVEQRKELVKLLKNHSAQAETRLLCKANRVALSCCGVGCALMVAGSLTLGYGATILADGSVPAKVLAVPCVVASLAGISFSAPLGLTCAHFLGEHEQAKRDIAAIKDFLKKFEKCLIVDEPTAQQ